MEIKSQRGERHQYKVTQYINKPARARSTLPMPSMGLHLPCSTDSKESAECVSLPMEEELLCVKKSKSLWGQAIG